MCHAQERLQQTQKPSFFLCQLTLTYNKQASTNFFPVDSHDNLVSRHRYKNWSEKCTVWPIGIAFKHKPNHQSFFSGFSTGFLRLKKNEFFFWKPGVLRIRTGFLRTIKTHNFPSSKTNLALGPLNPENNVDFFCKFTFKVSWNAWKVNNLEYVPLRVFERIFFHTITIS